MTEATNWLAHNTRAWPTGLRKMGYMLEQYMRDDVTGYRFVEAGDGHGG